MAIVKQLVTVAALYVTYWIITSIARRRQFNNFALKNGCLPAPDVSGSFPYGWARLQRLMKLKTSGEDIIDDILADDFRKGNSNTVESTSFDYTVMIHTLEPANLQAILATKFKDFETGKRRYQQFGTALGRSIFTSDGAFWEHSRALFRPQFSRENINDLDGTGHAAELLIKAVGETKSDGWTEAADLYPLLLNFTLDTATEFLFGECVDSQASGIKACANKGNGNGEVDQSFGAQGSSAEFRDDFALIGDYMLKRLRLQSFYWLGDAFEYRRAIASVRKFTSYFVDRAIESAKSDKVETRKYNLLTELAKQTQNKTELRDQMLAILFAGRDTTAGLLAWCFTRLALHPDKFDKLRKIILEEFPEDKPVTFAGLKGCRYLQHFLNETLRLHSTVPLNNRYATCDTVLPVGGGPDQKSPVAMKKGQLVIFSVYLMHRRKDLWGDDAEEFRPERWEERRVPAWHFLPFLGGPRLCIGQQFALTEASFVLVKLLRHFDKMEPVDAEKMKKMPKGLGLTMWPKDGVNVRFHKAA